LQFLGPVKSADVTVALRPWEQIRHRGDWGAWCALAAGAPPFLSAEFFALTRRLRPDGDAVLAEAWSDGRMIGALPLVLDGDVLEALDSEHSPRYDYCGSPEGLEAIWRALGTDRRWAQLILPHVPVASLLATRLPELARAGGCPVTLLPAEHQRYFALPGFEARLSKKLRGELKRHGRHVGELTLERIPAPARSTFDEALAIEAMAWKGAAGTSITSHPGAEHLYRALLRALGPRGRAALYFLRANGARIATLLAVEDGHTLFALKIGYDPAFARDSPGQLLVWQVALDAERRGLQQLELLGRDDEWKRRWTDEVHDQVTVVIYRRSPRGLLRYTLREVVKPRLPESIRTGGLRSPLPRGCQRTDVIGRYKRVERVHVHVDQARDLLGRLRSALRPRPPGPKLGAPSRFAPGSWVRVLDADRIQATLDERSRLRGLQFLPAQLQSCGQVKRVQRQVRRVVDDHGRWRAVSGTVILEGVDCGGAGPEPAGCGRVCPLMFRDEWLEPAEAPAHVAPAPSNKRHARVRDPSEIAAGLDLRGRRDGLTFMPEMAACAGRRVQIARQITQVLEHDRWASPPKPIYVLEGLCCSGEGRGASGPCDRACPLLWHEDWLTIEPPTT
jgi:hypothetical protein